jgi:isoquinoline 1-oxidoreductase beta subunit
MPTRRTFIAAGAAVGGGLILAYGYGRQALDDGDAARKFAAGGSAQPLNAWLKIHPDGRVVCAIHRAEMGQGVTTSLAMLLAEELDADWTQVSFEFAPVDRDYFNFGMLQNGRPFGDPADSWRAATGTWAMRQLFWSLGLSMTISSTSIIDAWDTLRPAGATARQLLLQAAARRWGMGAAELTTAAGAVLSPDGRRRLSYGELAEAAGQERPPRKVRLKSPAEYRLVGRSLPRLDTPAKVTGAATFGIDVRLPGMLFATLVHAPVAGSQVAGYTAPDSATLPGVSAILKVGKPGAETAVAVVADATWAALQAAQQVQVSAVAPATPADTRDYVAAYTALLGSPDAVTFRDDAPHGAADAGAATLEAALDGAATRVSATYAVPYLAHMCMEPMNCTAWLQDDHLTVWAPTQAHSIARDIAAAVCGLEPEQVTLHMTFMGGGFGRRAEMDFVEQAASLARQLPGRPVQLVWSREQDTRHDAFRPAALCRISAGLTTAGDIRALDYELVTQSVTASYETRTPTPRGGDAQSDQSVLTSVDPPVYPVARLRLRNTPVVSHVPAGFWRSVSHSWNTFFLESFIDELAAAQGATGLEFRRYLLAGEPRLLAVLNAVAEASGTPAAGTGYAIARSHGTVVAHAVQVSTVAGEFAAVTRVVCAIDCGPVVHPDGVIAQVESSIVDGLSAALYGEVDFRAGSAQQGNFDRYRRLRLADTPPIEVLLVSGTAERPGGVGEPALPGVAPALVNAIAAATGTRIRTLPIRRTS